MGHPQVSLVVSPTEPEEKRSKKRSRSPEPLKVPKNGKFEPAMVGIAFGAARNWHRSASSLARYLRCSPPTAAKFLRAVRSGLTLADMLAQYGTKPSPRVFITQ